MFFRISILLLICVSIVSDSHAQKNKKQTNSEVFEKIVNNIIKDIIYKPGVERDYNFVFNISDKKNDNDNISFLKYTIKKSLKDDNVKLSFSNNYSEITDSNTNIVELKIENLKTIYSGFVKNNFLGEKSVKREITVELQYMIKSKANTNSISETILRNSNDEIPYNEIEVLEASPYKFTKSGIPALSSFENIFFPLTLVVVSAITVILFFAIRTK